MRFTDIKKILNISKQSLSKNLSLLLKDNTIQFTKKGKEKYYKIKKTKTSALERNVIEYSTHYYMDLIDELEDKREKGKKIEDLYNMLSTTLGVSFLYLVLKSLETGENWLSGLEPNKMAVLVTNYLMSITLEKPLTKIRYVSLFTDEMMKVIFKDMHTILEMNNNIRELHNHTESLRKRYPTQMQLIDSIMNNFLN